MASLFSSLFGGEKKEDEETMGAPEGGTVEQPLPVGIQNPMVRDYMLNRQKLVDKQREESSGPDYGGAALSLVDGITGRTDADDYVKGKKDARANELKQMDDGFKTFGDANRMDFDLQKMGQERDAFSKDSDPSSEESKMAQDLAMQMGVNPEIAGKITAEQWKSKGPMYQKMFELKQNQRMKREELNAKNQNAMPKMTVAQEAVDKKYADEYNKFTAKGMENASTAISNLENLQKQVAADTGFGEAGGTRLPIPDFMRSRLAIERRDDARNFANTTLKELFGGQLSDAEREAAAREYWNDSLDNESNAKRLAGKIEALKRNFESQRQKAKYYEENGTLAGFKAINEDGGGAIVKVRGPDGKIRNIPRDQLQAALKAGGEQVDKSVAKMGQ